MGYEFDEDTAVTPAGQGRFTATLTDRWGIGDRPNGGYLMAVALRALAQMADHPDPLSMTVHFLRPPAAGPVDLGVELVRAGRTVSTAQVQMWAQDREYLRGIAAFGDLGKASGVSALPTPPPELPAPEDCSSPPRGSDMLSLTIADRFDLRLPDSGLGWTRGAPSGRGQLAGWIRFADERPPDLLSLVQFTDAMPPAVMDMGIFDPVPTIELTAHLRAHPVPGWLRFLVRATDIVDGYLQEEASLWDERGTLVAMSRQFAVLVGIPTSR